MIKGLPLKVGIGGPVGAGKTSLTEMLCRNLSSNYSMAVITNDIYTACLLYTSPSPRDATLSRMPSSA